MLFILTCKTSVSSSFLLCQIVWLISIFIYIYIYKHQRCWAGRYMVQFSGCNDVVDGWYVCLRFQDLHYKEIGFVCVSWSMFSSSISSPKSTTKEKHQSSISPWVNLLKKIGISNATFVNLDLCNTTVTQGYFLKTVCNFTAVFSCSNPLWGQRTFNRSFPN